MSDGRQLLNALKPFLHIGSYQLSGGETSRYYLDCKAALSRPEIRWLAAQAALGPVLGFSSRVDAVGGMGVGATLLASAVSDAAYRSGRNLTVFAVRPEPKAHGLKKRIEGDFRRGDNGVIVEDVVTTGGSAIKAIERARECGIQVLRMIALVRRGDSLKIVEQATGVPCQAFMPLSVLVGAEASQWGPICGCEHRKREHAWGSVVGAGMGLAQECLHGECRCAVYHEDWPATEREIEAQRSAGKELKQVPLPPSHPAKTSDAQRTKDARGDKAPP